MLFVAIDDSVSGGNIENVLRQTYLKSTEMLVELKAGGISGGVYTQTSDVESEINGFLTYDRKVQKVSANVLADIHRRILGELE